MFSIMSFRLALNAFQSISCSQNVKNLQLRGPLDPEAQGQIAPPAPLSAAPGRSALMVAHYRVHGCREKWAVPIRLIIVAKNKNCQAYLCVFPVFPSSPLSRRFMILFPRHIQHGLAAWPRFVLNSTQPHFELSELLQWRECGATAERTSEREGEKRMGEK